MANLAIENQFDKPEIAWFLGWLIGDGSLSKKMGLSFELKRQDALDIYEKFCKLFNRKFSKKERTRQIFVNGRIYTHNSVYFNISGIGFGLRTKDKIINLLGQKKEKIPEFLFTSPNDVKFAFLKGIFESDGSLSVTNTYRGKKYLELIIYSPSEEFLKQLKQLFPFFGQIQQDKRSQRGFFRVKVAMEGIIKQLYERFYANNEWYLASKKKKFEELAHLVN